MKKTTIFASVILGAGVATSASAQEFDPGNFYAGAGVNVNSMSGWDSAFGVQIFGGYNVGEIFGVDKLDLVIEGGYLTTDDFERSFFPDVSYSGIWGTGGVMYHLNDRWSFFARAGYSIGDFSNDGGFFDDNSIMIGGGAAYHLMESLELRGELVERDELSSVQANVVLDF